MEKELLEAFVSQVIAHSDYEEMDRIYLCNRVLALVGEAGARKETQAAGLLTLRDELVALAVENGMTGSLAEEQEVLSAQLMDLVTPSPSQVNRRFWETYQENPSQAIADFYDLSKRNDYIKVDAIARNHYFPVETEYGQLEITINLSKPEKDPKSIAAARQAASSSYPQCQLCMENEGYAGRLNHPARSNHRVIRYQLGEEAWGFQYSPYAYFNEHCIYFYSQHQPMKISAKTFERLLAIVDQFPGYFVGSNTDLPIVGGSILSHEHYQGGRHTFAMETAEIEKQVTFVGFEDVTAGIVKWPMSVLRLASRQKASLLALASKILEEWQAYSDEAVGIRAFTKGERHHTVTPIARKKGDVYELDVVLRDNQTSEEFPDGIYHPHPDVQHIKKENIGLIEVMGLAILPPRLKEELVEVEQYLLGQPHKVKDYHVAWAERLKRETTGSITPQNVTEIVQEAVGRVFERVLEDAGVYKRTPEGQKAFLRFVESVGIHQ